MIQNLSIFWGKLKVVFPQKNRWYFSFPSIALASSTNSPTFSTPFEEEKIGLLLYIPDN